MAPKLKTNKNSDHADFAGPDHDKANMDKLTEQKAAENAANGMGHNSGDPPDEVIQRNANAIEVALIEIETAMRVVQKARADLGAALKTAKTDMGSKEWATEVMESVKLKRAAAKGGAGSIVSSHRMKGRILRLLDTPLGTQFGLFDMPAATATSADGKPEASENEAELRGEQDYKAGLKITDNNYMPGTPQFAAWAAGWVRAQKANVAGIGGADNDGGQSPGDTNVH